MGVSKKARGLSSDTAGLLLLIELPMPQRGFVKSFVYVILYIAHVEALGCLLVAMFACSDAE